MDLNTNSTRRGRLAAAALVPVLIFGGALALPATASAAEGDEQIVTVQEVVEDNSGTETGQDAPEADLIEEQPAEEKPAEIPAGFGLAALLAGLAGIGLTLIGRKKKSTI